uniref:Calponin-homology (CH) domain-containing protein n=2 Tax=gambiae species complex TaxID=44542 RepID=A0A8W7PCH1_ANOCL
MLGRCVSGQGSSDDLSVTKNLSQIYTDWANYYLERAKSKKKVSDLSADCRDGLLLAEVIEAVTTFKVPDLVKKPKTAQHMIVGGLKGRPFLQKMHFRPVWMKQAFTAADRISRSRCSVD